MDPTRGKVGFGLDVSSFNSLEQATLSTLQQLLESELYMWDDFPINLPESRLKKIDVSLDLLSLFKDPNDFDLEDIARDPSGKLKSLNEDQLKAIRENGTFQVQGEQDQLHVWELNRILQTGSVNRGQVQKTIWAHALGQLHHIKHRIVSKERLSLRNGLLRLKDGLLDIPDLFFGITELEPRHSEQSISWQLEPERRQFILRDLQEVKHNIFVCPTTNQQIDFRLHDFLATPAVPVILEAIEKEHVKQWAKDLIAFRFELQKGITAEMTPQDLADEEVKAFNSQLLTQIRASQQLAEIDTELPGLIADQLAASQLLETMEFKRLNELKKYKENLHQELKTQYPIWSLVDSWVQETVEHRYDLYQKQRNQEAELRELDAELQKAGLKQHSYLLQREMVWKPVKQVLKDQLIKQTIPSSKQSYQLRIWRPKNWTITPVADTSVNIKALRVRYEYQNYTTIENSSDHFGWRLRGVGLKTWSLINNSLFRLLANAVDGPVGLKALFFKNAFYPQRRVNPKSGEIETDREYKVNSLSSYIIDLWEHVQKSVKAFEAARDTGFLGKTVSRIFHRIWHYGVKGILGTLTLGVCFPVGCIINELVSLGLVATCPVWAPAIAIFSYVWDILILDTKKKSWRFLPLVQSTLKSTFKGVVQIASAIIMAGAMHPAVALTSTVCGTLFGVSWSIYDFLIFHTIIKPFARVPASDSFLSRRTCGPGLSSNYFYKISPDLVYLVLQAELERQEIDLFYSKTRQQVDSPHEKCSLLYTKLFNPFGLIMDESHHVYQKIKQRDDEIQHDLTQAVYNRSQNLYVDANDIPHYAQQHISLPRATLGVVIAKCCLIVETYTTDKIHCYLASEDELTEWWSEKSLARDDWEGLTRKLLAQLFGESILIPVEELDTSFSLKVNHLEATDFMTNIFKGFSRDDLSKVEQKFVPVGHAWAGQRPSQRTISFPMLHHTGTLCAWSRQRKNRTSGI